MVIFNSYVKLPEGISSIAKVVSKFSSNAGAGVFTNIFTWQNHQVNIHIYLYFIDGAYGIDIDRSWVGHGDLGIAGIYNLTDQVGRSSRSGTMAIPTRIQLENGDQVWAPEDSDNFVRLKKAKQDGYAAWDV